MKSIKSFLIVVMAAIVVTVGALSIVIAYGFARSTAMQIIYDNLLSLADAVSTDIATQLDVEMAVLDVLATTDMIASPEQPLEEKAAYLTRARDIDPSRLNYTIVDMQGNGVNTDGARINLADRDYIRSVMQGNPCISDPLEDRGRPGSLIFGYAVPLRDERGNVQSALVLNKDARELSDILADIPIGKTGGCYIISNTTGNTVAHYSLFSAVQSAMNMEREATKDPSLRALADCVAAARTGATGVSAYKYNGRATLAAYTALPSQYVSWSVIATAPQAEFTGGLTTMLMAMVIVAAAFCVAGVVVAVIIATSLAKPITLVCDALECVSKGDLVIAH